MSTWKALYLRRAEIHKTKQPSMYVTRVPPSELRGHEERSLEILIKSQK